MQEQQKQKIKAIAQKLGEHIGVEFAMDLKNTLSMAAAYSLTAQDKEILFRLKTYERVVSSLDNTDKFERFAGNVARYMASEKTTPKIVVIVNDEPAFMEDAVILARPI